MYAGVSPFFRGLLRYIMTDSDVTVYPSSFLGLLMNGPLSTFGVHLRGMLSALRLYLRLVDVLWVAV